MPGIDGCGGDAVAAGRRPQKESRFLDLVDQLKTEYEQERSSWQVRCRNLERTLEAHSKRLCAMNAANSTNLSFSNEPSDAQAVGQPASLQVSQARSRVVEDGMARKRFELQDMWKQLPRASCQWNIEVLERSAGQGTTYARRAFCSQNTVFLDWTRSAVQVRPLYISPSGNPRLAWDVLGFILIAYDVLSIPMLAFRLPSNDFSDFMDWLTLMFWTIDSMQSFFLGYYSRGALVTDRLAIVKHYLCTWFILDLIIIVPEWFMVISNALEVDDPSNESDVSSLGRFLRAARAVRVLRLLRLLKLQRIIAQVQEMIESEYAFTLIGLFKLLLCILILNHVIACVWYLIGNTSMNEGSRNWLEKTGTNGTDVAYSYTTSLHWSLTQFTPASVDVSATNVAERVFSILVLLFAIVAFSSIVANITGMLASINNSHTEEMKQFWLLRKYLRQRHVAKDLTTRIFKYLEHQIQSQQQAVQETNIKLLGKLSGPLTDELQSQIYSPIIMHHGFFEALRYDIPAALPHICNSSLRVTSLASEDVVFVSDAESRFFYFVKSGVFKYTQKYWARAKDSLKQNQWICEPTMWTVWRHFGDLTTAVPGELLTVDPKGFVTTLADYARAWFFARTYAEEFIIHLNSFEVADLSDFIPEVTFQRTTIEKARGKSTVQAIRTSLQSSQLMLTNDSVANIADRNSARDSITTEVGQVQATDDCLHL